MSNITYDTIIKYLCNNENSESDFPTKENLLRYSEYFTENIKKYIPNKFFRYGILQFDNEQNNISLYSSLLHLLNDKFVLKNKHEKIIYINKIREQVRHYLKKKYKNFRLKNKFDKEYSRNLIKSNKNTSLTLELLCFCFNINILICDFKDDTIKTVYNGDFFNPWKVTVILSKYNNIWEPIYTDNDRLFDYNNQVIQKICHDNLSYVDSDYLDKEYMLMDNFEEILNLEKEDNNNIDIDDNSKNKSTKTFISKIKLKHNYSESKLKKMTKDKLIELSNELDLNLNLNKKTKKKYIIENILKNKV
jgi:hypothetical protein